MSASRKADKAFAADQKALKYGVEYDVLRFGNISDLLEKKSQTKTHPLKLTMPPTHSAE